MADFAFLSVFYLLLEKVGGMRNLKLVCAFLAPVLLLSLGCGPEAPPESVVVTGKVTFDGAPVADGEIIFRDVAGNTRSCGGKITNGQYSFDASLGSKTVEITAMREVPGEMDESNPGESVPLMEMYIPEMYNTETTLDATVTGSEGEEFNFELSP